MLTIFSGVSFSFKVPITTLDSTLSMSLPFTWDYPTSKKRRSSSGRSLDGGFMEDKVDIYKAIETVLGKATGKIKLLLFEYRTVCIILSTLLSFLF